MADAITFAPYLTWVDVLNPNEPPENAKLVQAADLLRYENFGVSASKLLNAHETRLNGLDTSAATLNSGLTAANTAIGTANTKITSLTSVVDTKAPKANPTFTGTVSGVTKAMVGLGNVDNTSDANKPVSTPQKTYIDAVGTRVTNLERVKGLGKVGAPSFSVSNTASLTVQIPSIAVQAGRAYQITVAFKGYSSVADTAMELQVRRGAVGTTGINTNDQMLFSTTVWSHPTRRASGSGYTLGSIWESTVTGNVRLYLTGVVVVTTESLFTMSTSDQPLTLLVEDMGDI